VVTLIDRNRKTRINHRIVEIKEYPADCTLNTVSLSTIAGKVTGKITTLANKVTALDAQQLHDHSKVNEIKQDLDTTVLHISDSWASSVNESLFTQTADGLYMQVDKIVGTNRWSTLIRQSAEDIQFAWNNCSEYIKFESSKLNIYDTNDKLLMSFGSQGQTFYYKDYSVGMIGTNPYAHDETLRGLSFGMENSAAFMTWAYRENSNDDAYSMKLAYTAKKVGNYDANQLHTSCDLNLHGYNLRNAVFKDCTFEGGGITGTISGYYVTSFNSDGTAATWKGLKLVFVNGILQDASW
jgi:hypothetical protein